MILSGGSEQRGGTPTWQCPVMRGMLSLLSKGESNKIIYIKQKNMFKTDPRQMHAYSD